MLVADPADEEHAPAVPRRFPDRGHVAVAPVARYHVAAWTDLLEEGRELHRVDERGPHRLRAVGVVQHPEPVVQPRRRVGGRADRDAIVEGACPAEGAVGVEAPQAHARFARAAQRADQHLARAVAVEIGDRDGCAPAGVFRGERVVRDGLIERDAPEFGARRVVDQQRVALDRPALGLSGGIDIRRHERHATAGGTPGDGADDGREQHACQRDPPAWRATLTRSRARWCGDRCG